VQFDWEKSSYFTTPLTQEADMTQLNTLPRVKLTATAHAEHRPGGELVVKVRLRNPSQSLAFMAHVALRKSENGASVLPILWDDNYVSLMPNEERVITGTGAPRDFGTGTPTVQVDGWNIAPLKIAAVSAPAKR
jgi:exo-1,4-beta-D-glucosaminidase